MLEDACHIAMPVQEQRHSSRLVHDTLPRPERHFQTLPSVTVKNDRDNIAVVCSSNIVRPAEISHEDSRKRKLSD
jgi:hypothetical protein